MSVKIQKNDDILNTLKTLKSFREGMPNATKKKVEEIINGILDHHYGSYIKKND